MQKMLAMIVGFALALTAFAQLEFDADAMSVVRNVGYLHRNLDGSFDEKYPNGDKPPNGPLLACDNTNMPSLSGLVAGSGAVNYDSGQYFSGTAKTDPFTTYRLVTVSGNDAATYGWSLTGTIGTTLNLSSSLANPGSIGSGALQIIGNVSGVGDVPCTLRNWSVIAPQAADTSRPNPVTKLQAPSVGTNLVNLTHRATIDPAGSLPRGGVAQYCYYRNSVLVGTCDAAASPGLVVNWVGGNVGAPALSNSCTQVGVGLVITSSGAIEQNVPDKYYACKQAVSGPVVHWAVAIGAGGVPLSGPFDKLVLDLADAKDTTTAISAEVTLLHAQSNGAWSIEVCPRVVDGANRHCIASIPIGSGPNSIALDFDATLGMTVSHSYDGGATYTADVTNSPVPLPDAKIARLTAVPTSDAAQLSVGLDWVTLSTAPDISKALTTVPGSATFTVTAKDMAGNESTALAGVIAVPLAGGPPATAKRWHPGDYVQNWRDAPHLLQQGTRFAEYDQSTFASDCNIKGAVYQAPLNQLEGATHGDYAAGFALIHAEINHLKALPCPKRLTLQLFDELNYSICQSASCQANYYPVYMLSCLAQGVEGGGGGGGVITHIEDWNPTCRQYVLDLIAAYGAEFKNETFLEAFGYPYERIVQTCCQLNGYSNAAYDSATRTIAQAMQTAFPNTIVFMTLNWYTGDATQFAALVAYLDSIGVGWGPGDVLYQAGVVPYQNIDKLTVGLLGGPDYRGRVPLLWKYEATELGYTGNGDSQKGYTGAEIYNYVNNTIHTNYLFNERNVFIGWDNSRWFACGSNNSPSGTNFNSFCGGPTAGGLKARIDTPTPFTHLSCPTQLDVLYGNGIAGSGTGCDTTP